MSLVWYQDHAIPDPSLWMAEDGDYCLSVYRDSRGWAFIVWFGSPATVIEADKHLTDRDDAMRKAEDAVVAHKAQAVKS